MDVTFGFLNGRDVFRAALPPSVTVGGEAASCLVLSAAIGERAAVQYRSSTYFDSAHTDETFRINKTSAQGTTVAIYDYPASDPMTLAYWTLPIGSLWVALETNPDGSAALDELLAGLRVFQDGLGIPRITIGDPLTAGDLTQEDERDTVMFVSQDDTLTPTSVVFTNGSTEGTDEAQTDANDGEIAVVSVPTSLGLTVTCDGPAGNLAGVIQAATNVAASVRQTEAVSTGTINLNISASLSYAPLILDDGPRTGNFTVSGNGAVESSGGTGVVVNQPFTVSGSGTWKTHRTIDPVEFNGTMHGVTNDGRWTFDSTFSVWLPVANADSAQLYFQGAAADTLVTVSGLTCKGPFLLPPDVLANWDAIGG